MKIRRFVTEYANYQLDAVMNNDFLSADQKIEQMRPIYKIVDNLRFGLITVDECMRLLSSLGEEA